MADKIFESHVAGISEKFVDQEDGTHARGVTIVGLDTPVELTGEVSVASWGDVDDAKVTNPDAASATVPALLRGLLAEAKAQTALLTTIASNTTPT